MSNFFSSAVVARCIRILASGILLVGSMPNAARGATAPDDLDLGFGHGGQVVTPLAALTDVIVDTSGRILVAGTLPTATPGGAVVVRYQANGELDPSFGEGGVARMEIAPEPFGILAMVVQPTDRPVLALASTDQFVVLRLTVDGAVDPSFQPHYFETAGHRFIGEFFGLLARTDGALELAMVNVSAGGAFFGHTTFDPDGNVLGGGGNPADDVRDVRTALDPQGRLVVANSVATSNTGPASIELARYQREGTLDPSFGIGGRAPIDLTVPLFHRSALTVAADGRIVVASIAGSSLEVARLHTDGEQDHAFGTDAIATVDLDQTRTPVVNSVATTRDGRILVAGATDVVPEQSRWQIVAFSVDGTLDASFGTGGILTGTSESLGDGAYVVRVQPNGRVIVAGHLSDRMVIRRLMGFPRACGDADGDGEISVTDGVQVLRAAAELPSTCRVDDCDVDASGVITVSDGIRTLQNAAGLKNLLRCRP